MTAPRPCRTCGGRLLPDVMWCTQCYEPIRHLTPRDRQLPTPPDLQPVDPATIRRDQAFVRPHRPVYSRVRRGPTTLGLWGRVTCTAIVLFFLPWGPFTFVTVLYLVAYMPIAAILLAAIWRRDVVGPIETSAVVHAVSTLTTIRACAAGIGVALMAVALVAGAGPLGYVPAAPFLFVAVWPGTAEGVDEGIEEAKARPLGALVLLNGLNVLDVILSDAAIGAGTASELNPFVLAVGTPVKLALVAACSVLLYWKRPRALVWPSLAFVVLAAYHLTGLLGGLALA